MQKKETEHLSHTITQKSTQNGLKTNIRPETVKLLEESIGKKLLDIGLGNDFLHMTPGAQMTKVKMDKWDSIKLKSFHRAKETINRVKRPPMKWEKIFSDHTFDNRLISKTYLELKKLNI